MRKFGKLALLFGAFFYLAPSLASKTINFEELFVEAEKSAQEFEKDMENNARFQHEKAGDKFVVDKKYGKALREYDAAIQLDPKVATVFVKKGIALYKSGRAAAALKYIDQGIRLNTRSEVWTWWPLLHKGIALQMDGESKRAISALSKSIKLNATVDAYLWRAIAYSETDQLQKAGSDIASGAKLKSNDSRLAVVAKEVNRRKSAITVLQDMAAKDGAIQTGSGLVYFVLKPGSGARPRADDVVRVHYHGTLPDGTIFDSSVQRDEPAVFGLDRVIACWTEALQKMQVGAKHRLVCPAHIAYGERGSGDKIKPGATLLFDVNLLAIKPR